MPHIIDQYNDPTFTHLYVLTKDKPLARQMLKKASFEKEAAAQLPSSAFAWPDERRFAIHTKEDTLASLLYRQKCASVPSHVDAMLEKAAQIYGLGEHVLASTQTKTASEQQHTVYALPDEERLPVDDAAQVKVAEHVLNRDFERLSLEKRAGAYQRLVGAAKTHGVELNEFTHKMAGMVACSSDVLRDALETRATAAGPGSVRKAFDKLASELKRAPALLRKRDDLTKLASTIYDLDQKAGLDRHYDRKLPDPLRTVFNTNIKLSEDMCDVAGQPISCAKLMALPEGVWDQLDVPELKKTATAGDSTMFKQIFETLPLDLKVALKAHL